MATYIALVNFTDQGVRHIRQTTDRAKSLARAASNAGIEIKNIYWTLGRFDAVFIADAPDVETITAFALSMGSLGQYSHTNLAGFFSGRDEQDSRESPRGKFYCDEVKQRGVRYGDN